MRILLALAITVLPSAGLADAVDDQIAAYYDLRPQCRQGEDGDKQLSEAETKLACENLNKVGEQIVASGYCWNGSEQEWTQDKDLCKD